MSKINAVRIINLNYNNNAMRISDETFQMGGKSTLMSLRNGGGKSVLVQIMTAPFVHKQYRKTKDRPFEGYFSTSKPTIIMVEWALDQGAGYCLTGMMVRKSQVSEEQSSEPLEIIHFVSEYSARCEHDIYHIPVVEKSKNEVVLKNFNANRQLFELYKKDSSKRFFYYDMNNYAQSRQYFDKIAEYKIYYKEWETIIRKVNTKESGLSELFADCKNEKELIEKWFLETIQDKLNKEQNYTKEFQSLVDKYIRMYKDNQSKIERRDTILKFKEDMLEVEEKAESFRRTEQKVQVLENRIANFRQELNRIEELAKQQDSVLEERRQECSDNISHFLYEKLSMEIHNLSDELRNHQDNLEAIQEKKDELAEEILGIEKKVHLYECAKQQEDVDKQKQEYERLTQKIDVFRKNEKELEPERKQLGGCLKTYYEKSLQELRTLQQEKSNEYEKTQSRWESQKARLQDLEKQIQNLLVEIAKSETRKENFNDKEEGFNRNYKENFCRNILGDYEPGLLEIKKEQYEKELTDLTRNHTGHLRELSELEEKKKSCERDRDDRKNAKQNQEFELHQLQEQEKVYEGELKERQNIMKYLELEENFLWNQQELMHGADRKISEIDRSRTAMEQEKTELEKEWKKLTSGEVLELPQDFKDLLEELSLHPVYGMNWLEKNGYSREENTRLVRRQPFLPYALILPKEEIHKLEQHGKDIYTSFPIPLIPREALEESVVEEERSVLSFSGICFYLWFNEKLLDEEELRLLITRKESEIKKKKDQIDNKKMEYKEYVERRSVLSGQSLSREAVEENRIKQREISENITELENSVLEINDRISKQESGLNQLGERIQREKQEIERFQHRIMDYQQFCEDYERYQQEKKRIEECEKKSNQCKSERDEEESRLKHCEEKLKSLDLEKQELDDQLHGIMEKQIKYAGYESVQIDNVNRPLDVMESRYEAITSKMSGELQELEDRQEEAGKRMMREQAELEGLKRKYHVTEREWKDISYNSKEQLHQEAMLADRKKEKGEKEHLWHEEDKKIEVQKSRISDKKRSMEQQCGCQEPLPKEEISVVDFEAEINRLKHRLKDIDEERKNVEQHMQSIQENLTVFAEYQDFVLIEPVQWEMALEDMDAKALRDFAGCMRRDYRQETQERQRKKNGLENCLNGLLRKEIYQEDYYRKPLETMLEVTEQAQLVLAQLNTTIQSYDSQMEKLAVDIAMVETEKEKIEGLLEDYVKQVHRNMGLIDNNSTITIRERPIKMLRLQIPDWDENEGLYRQRLSDFMDEVTKNGIQRYEQNENAADYLSTRITTKNLYDTIVGVGNVQIKLYKIEEQREYPITWAEVARNSGGEGFLSAFVVLSSLLQYMRRDETDIFADRNEGKVLVMDNPFAQTNAAHLLKPLMDMANKTNTQLICLSGLGGDSIYSRFDNIYVLNLVTTSLRGGMQYLRGEHTRGEEEEVMVSSQIEVMEQQSFLF